ncbi:hypothetical protein [Acetivibrio cellulolyticus]|uniref:hypothetical protein n=1 Tax=Acetivibrio cellulolyticus TaxID=35830 RepID=UPI0001E2BE0E|nr:hypothetical protein [Acetivibrio cellulolyticus]
MYSKLPSLIIGFHGCDKSIYNQVIKENLRLNPSENDYDWLGNGIYFWENNLVRAYEFALEKKERGQIEEVAVIGAVLDLGYCLDFVNSEYIKLLKEGYELLEADCLNAAIDLPDNKYMSNGVSLLRNLDCAVIQRIHQWNEDNNYKSFDSVRGVFFEGKEIFPNSGFREKNHIQICVRNINCIKGYFSPLEADSNYEIP